MTTSTPEGLMYQILSRMEETHRVASRLIGTNYGVFEAVSLEMPKFTPAELGFLRLETHHRLVQQLRTSLQHNLDPGKSHDRRIQEVCEQWLRDQCGTPIPGSDHQWQRCLLSLLLEALQFLEALLQTTRSIEQDESCGEICREWLFRIKRYHPPHAFDELISIVAADMGREAVDVVRLRTRFYDKWTQELHLLEPDYEFEIQARKLIEYALLTVTTPVLPITGKDIMEDFDIPPGPRVGQLLERARRIYDTKPCSRAVLLDQLRQEGL